MTVPLPESAWIFFAVSLIFHGGMMYYRLDTIARVQRRQLAEQSWASECIVRLAVKGDVDIPDRPRL